jgi:hypothetical protein
MTKKEHMLFIEKQIIKHTKSVEDYKSKNKEINDKLKDVRKNKDASDYYVKKYIEGLIEYRKWNHEQIRWHKKMLEQEQKMLKNF